MRRFHGILLAGLMPVAALAQDQGSVIRIEAKRGDAAAAEAVANWQSQFDDVVTFPLPRGWTGIGLGPMSQAEATERLETLKAQGTIPADSFIAAPGGTITQTAAAPAAALGTPADEPAAQPASPEPAPAQAEPPAAMQPEHFIRLEAFQDRAEAETALTTWRQPFPEAGLYQLPNGWFAIALGPLKEQTAAGWLAAFKAAQTAPQDAFIATQAEIGTAVDPGAALDLPDAPAQPGQMPPLDKVQRALRWAGHYDGTIDGKDGPKTRAAINAEIIAERRSPDAATAMQQLIQRRLDWRDEMGLTQLDDAHTGLSAILPMDMLAFDRNERALSIYGPKDGSGAALILFSQPGGQQELIDMSGLVIALGWVPQPERDVRNGAITLDGRNASHISHAEGRVADGRAEGFVLIWPASDAANQPRIAAELSDSFSRSAPAANDLATGDAAVIPVEQNVTDAATD